MAETIVTVQLAIAGQLRGIPKLPPRVTTTGSEREQRRYVMQRVDAVMDALHDGSSFNPWACAGMELGVGMGASAEVWTYGLFDNVETMRASFHQFAWRMFGNAECAAAGRDPEFPYRPDRRDLPGIGYPLRGSSRTGRVRVPVLESMNGRLFDKIVYHSLLAFRPSRVCVVRDGDVSLDDHEWTENRIVVYTNKDLRIRMMLLEAYAPLPSGVSDGNAFMLMTACSSVGDVRNVLAQPGAVLPEMPMRASEVAKMAAEFKKIQHDGKTFGPSPLGPCLAAALLQRQMRALDEPAVSANDYVRQQCRERELLMANGLLPIEPLSGVVTETTDERQRRMTDENLRRAFTGE